MAAKKKNVTEAEVNTEERENLIRDVTAEITERLVAEEEEQPVSEVESRCSVSRSVKHPDLTKINAHNNRFNSTLDHVLF